MSRRGSRGARPRLAAARLPFAGIRIPVAAALALAPVACGPGGEPPAEDRSREAAAAGGAATTGWAVEVEPESGERRFARLRMLTFEGENAEAYFSADGERLIFQGTRPGESECDQIYVMDADGGEPRMVSTGLGRTTCGYFFPSGDRILYSSTHRSLGPDCPPPPDRSRGYVWPLYDYDIFVAGADGSEPELLFRSPGYDAEATVSPDGSRIVFTSTMDGDLEIYSMASDGTDLRRLTHEEGYDGGAFFSPDGTKIVYRAWHPSVPEELADYRALLADGLVRPGRLEIRVMDADGGNKRRITDNGAANFAPFFHPDGERVIFSSNLRDPASRDFDLYLIRLDGTGLERVTTFGDFDGFPMFSPDGRRLVFGSNRHQRRPGETNVFVADWREEPEGPASGPATGAVSAETCPAPDALGGAMRLPLAAVRYLADDALAGRLAGGPGEACAAAYVARAFEEIGLEPAGEGGGWFQAVLLASQVNPHAPRGTGRNVLGLLRGGDPARAGEVVVVGAHVDHLGGGEFGSLAERAGEVHNGADDNASGVAAVLRAAQILASGPRPPRSILFVAFTGEELGLLGSRHYAAHPVMPLERTVAMLNLDMVGRLGDEPLVVYGVGTAEEWEEVVRAANRETGIALAVQASGFGPSDHTAFYERNIPVLHLFTNVHEDYHRPSDDWEKVDGEGLERVARFAARLAGEVAGGARGLTLVRGAGEPPPRAGEGYGAYLGTIPDFAPAEDGVRITGVSEGSPAERAGLRGGDVITALGGMEVRDLVGLTEALRAHQPGDEVEVAVMREGRALSLRAVLGRRPGRRP